MATAATNMAAWPESLGSRFPAQHTLTTFTTRLVVKRAWTEVNKRSNIVFLIAYVLSYTCMSYVFVLCWCAVVLTAHHIIQVPAIVPFTFMLRTTIPG